MSRQKYHQGKYKVQNRQKYLGNADNVIYRSGWEKQLMIKFDESPSILRWGSEVEGQHIWYRSPVDGQKHRYFVDFIVVMKTDSGPVVNLIEVKPYGQCFPPKKQGKKQARYITEVKTYVVNISKWRAARELCEEKGWVFKIVTEKGTLNVDPIIDQSPLSET